MSEVQVTKLSPNCGNALLPDALMAPRYKVIADYPLSANKVGDIITFSDYPYHAKMSKTTEWDDMGENRTCIHSCGEAAFSNYPHLFKKLEWWEERKVEEMPEYVKYKRLDNNDNVVCKAKDWKIQKDGKVTFKTGFDFFSCNKQDLPATEAEYLSYIDGLKK